MTKTMNRYPCIPKFCIRTGRFAGTILLLTVMLFFVFCLPARCPAQDQAKEREVPEELNPDIEYLLDFIGSDPREAFDPGRILNLLNFVASPKTDGTRYVADKKFGAASSYYSFDMQVGLEQLLQMTYNDAIPPHVFTPSSIRLSYWKEVSGQQKQFPELWKKLDNLSEPVIVRGLEHIENTPDLFAGAYYGYDLHRALCLFEHAGRPVFVSLSKQSAVSSVGKKGVVLGSDDSWDYFYTNDQGLSKAGFGWVRSHMYDSYAIVIYYVVDKEAPLLRYGIFKWIDAGWANMNFVESSHIFRGLERFGKTFKSILENPFLPQPQEMADLFSPFKHLSETDMKNQLAAYLDQLQRRYPSSTVLSREGLSNPAQRSAIVAGMKKEEMQSIIELEYMKYLLGRDSLIGRQAFFTGKRKKG